MIKKLTLIFLLCAIAQGQFWENPDQKPMLGQEIDFTRVNGLVGFWVMNEGVGDKVYDLSGNRNKGSLSSGLVWLSGPVIANTLSSADVITIPHSSSLIGMSALTIVVKAKNNKAFIGATGSEYMVLKGTSASNGNYTFYWSQAEDIVFSLPDTSGGDKYCSPDDFLTDTDWHQWVARWDGAEMSVWKDAVKASETTAFSGTLSVGTANLEFSGNGTNDSWDGQIEYVYIYNRALSTSEIQKLYENPFQMFEPVFPVWWYGGIGAPPAGGGQYIGIY